MESDSSVLLSDNIGGASSSLLITLLPYCLFLEVAFQANLIVSSDLSVHSAVFCFSSSNKSAELSANRK
jgi:hypothetical protein